MSSYRVVCCSVLLITSFSCGERRPDPPYSVHLIGFDGSSGFAGKTVTIKTLTNASTMEGSRCEVKVGTSIGGQTDNEGSPLTLTLDEGHSVHPEFVVKDGVVKPSNLLSSLAFGSYYLFEEISQFWIDHYALDMHAFGKIRIMLDPNDEGGVRLRTNAFYLGHGFQFFAILPPAGTELFPVGLNIKVLAHEFFHGVFDFIVFKRTSALYTKGRATDQWNIKGINEGLADFFSYTVTSNPDFSAEYLPEDAANRALPVAWRSQQVATPGAVIKSKIAGSHYAKGSVLASALYEIGQKTGQKPHTIGTQVLAALRAFSSIWAQNTWLGSFDFHYLINLILEQAPEAQRATYCSVFSYWFNDAANNKEITTKCATF